MKYFLRFSKTSPYSILLENSQSNEKVVFNFKRNVRHEIYSLPVGDYSVSSISKTETSYNANTNTSNTRTYYLNVPEDLLFDFTVEESKVTYLGDIKIKSKSLLGWFFGWDKTLFEYNLDREKVLLAEQFEHISEDDIISY